MQRFAIISMCLLAGCHTQQADSSRPASAADVLIQADRNISKTADALAAIDQAREVVAENLRNADTSGYKARIARVDGESAHIALDNSQGALESTSRPLDVAVSGNGYFRLKIETNDGPMQAYSRNGNFFVNNNNELVLGMGVGYRLDPPISIPANSTDISISQSGVVSVLVSGQVQKQTVGQIYLHSFVQPAMLKEINHAMYLETQTSGEPIESRPQENGAGQLLQGFLEKSNVQVDRERMRDEFLKKWRSSLVQQAEK